MAQVKWAIEPKRLPLEIDRVVFDEATIGACVQELAAEISQDYWNKELVVVGILKGATVFTCDLVRSLSIPVAVDFISITSYAHSPRNGSVRILKDLEESIQGRHVLLMEDLVDTGLTLNYLVRVIQSREPLSVAICSLLDRPDLRLADIPIKYTGFHVSQEFLIGYGMDYREQFRELPYIASMKFDTD
jgi:hypoxanthine phosphoribosyltransferase